MPSSDEIPHLPMQIFKNLMNCKGYRQSEFSNILIFSKKKAITYVFLRAVGSSENLTLAVLFGGHKMPPSPRLR